MKFWISAGASIALVTALVTAMLVYNPDLQKVPEKVVVEVTPNVPGDNTPVAVANKQQEKLDNVPQMNEGSTTFEIRNDGKGILQLSKGHKSCTCTELVLDKNAVAPGETAKFTMMWNTANRVGPVALTGEVKTNDPVRRSIVFTVELNVKQDLLIDPYEVSFGLTREGAKTERVVRMHSPLVDSLQITEPTVSTKAITVKLEPLSEEDKKQLGAKSGVKATLTCDGSLPVGEINEVLSFKTNIPRIPEYRLPLGGMVEGGITLVPRRADFGNIVGAQSRETRIEIFANALAADETLTLGKIEPAFIEGRLFQPDPKQLKTLWRLTLKVSPSAQSGPFKGSVSIVDNKGRKRVNLPVEGTVVASGVMTAARSP